MSRAGGAKAVHAERSEEAARLEELKRSLQEDPAGRALLGWVEGLIEAGLTREGLPARREYLRREHDLQTLGEVVRQLAERAFDARRMDVYLLRTLMGRFMVWKVLIFRRDERGRLRLAGSRGLGPYREKSEKGLAFAADSELAWELMRCGGVLNLEDAPETPGRLPPAPPGPEGGPGIGELKKLGLSTLVPLRCPEEGEVCLEGFFALGPRVAERAFRPGDLRLLEIIARVVAVSFRNERLFRRSVTDELTGLVSRSYFEAQVALEIPRCERYEREGLAVVFVDVDGMTAFNRLYDRRGGDTALKRLAGLLRTSVRSSDLVARYGGDQFAVLLVEVKGRESALRVAERLRRTLRSRPVAEKEGTGVTVTASLGAAFFPGDGEGPRELLAAAEAAVARAKRLGGDRVSLAPAEAGDKAEVRPCRGEAPDA